MTGKPVKESELREALQVLASCYATPSPITDRINVAMTPEPGERAFKAWFVVHDFLEHGLKP